MPNKHTLLIIDDSKIARTMIYALVKSLRPDLEVLEAADGAEAIQLASENEIDYFSVDVNMPNMDGFEVVNILKPAKPDAIFVLMTANIQMSTHKKADQLGAGVVYKPITENSVRQLLEYFNK